MYYGILPKRRGAQQIDNTTSMTATLSNAETADDLNPGIGLPAGVTIGFSGSALDAHLYFGTESDEATVVGNPQSNIHLHMYEGTDQVEIDDSADFLRNHWEFAQNQLTSFSGPPFSTPEGSPGFAPMDNPFSLK